MKFAEAEVARGAGARNVRLRPAEEVAWAFPDAWGVSMAAGFFPDLSHDGLEYQHVLGLGGGRDVDVEGPEGLYRRHAVAAATAMETRTPLEGPRYFLRIAPGNVQVYRVDPARRERTRARLSEARARGAEMEAVYERVLGDTPMALRARVGAGGDDAAPVEDRRVGPWSGKSRRRLVQVIGQLDLAPIVGGERPPALVTLTLPGDWLAVCPDYQAGVRIMERFGKRWYRRWGEPLRCIWKREFQRRGAPHWHLWLAPPADFGPFSEWLAETWTDCLRIDRSTEHGRQEDANSRRAGTGVDYARAADARDPRRLALYFLKETLGGEQKAYQNRPPVEWEGKSSGRYWGTKGLEKVTADVALTADDGVRIWRVLRRVRGASLVQKRKLRCVREHEHSGRCFRVQRRRAVAPAEAGWVAVNDGPEVAIALSRLVDPPATGRFGWFAGPSLARQALDALA